MKIIETKEVIENDITYIVNTYDNGTIEKYIKPSGEPIPEPEPQAPPVTNEELSTKIDSLDQQTTALMLGMADIFSAILEGGAK